MTAPLLSVVDLTVARAAGPLLEGLNINLTAGEVTALIGVNGVGKTSLLETISGIIPAGAGTITLGQTNLTRLSRAKRAHAGLTLVEQGRAVFPSLTVRENILLTARTQSVLDEALALFPELKKRLHSPANLLSGGEQQMVTLARAIASRSKVLMIDEMSLGLAPVVFQRLLPVVAQIAASGVAVLLVEQFVHHALAVSQQAIVIAGGRVAYQGPSQELRDQPERLTGLYLG